MRRLGMLDGMPNTRSKPLLIAHPFACNSFHALERHVQEMGSGNCLTECRAPSLDMQKVQGHPHQAQAEAVEWGGGMTAPLTARPRSTSRANSTRPLQKQFLRRSTRLKPNPPAALALLPRVLHLRLLHLRDLPLQHLLRHQPLRRICIRAARMNRVHADIQDVPATEAA